jgi:hypothetical protein
MTAHHANQAADDLMKGSTCLGGLTILFELNTQPKGAIGFAD